MKRIFISLLLSLNLFGCEVSTPKVVSYDICHKNALLTIAFEDALKFFCGSEVVTRGLMTEEQFAEANKKEMEAILHNPHSVTRVLLVEDTVVGFVEFSKTREPSIESILKMMTAEGLPVCSETAIGCRNATT